MMNAINLDFTALQIQFDTLLAKEVPLPKANRTTFLEIAQMPHHEVVISRIYKFYLQSNAEHGFKDLFLRSLIELINEKRNPAFGGPAFQIPGEWNCMTEVATKKGNRIDIWIDWKEENRVKTIVIENKIYHFLRNDLEDYFNTAEGHANHKVGVLLTLGRQVPSHPGFINLTHADWLNSIKRNLGTYISGADDLHLLFLKDLMTIRN